MEKQGPAFWKCWRSKFEPNKHFVSHVDRIGEAGIIAAHFAGHFGRVCSNRSESGAARLMNEYLSKRSGYQGHPYNDSYAFDAELVENVIGKLKRGKAAGLDNLTCNHAPSVQPHSITRGATTAEKLRDQGLGPNNGALALRARPQPLPSGE